MTDVKVASARPLTAKARIARMYCDGKLTTILLFLPPALLLFTLFVVTPILNAAHLSMYRWSGFGEVTDYVGLKNYSTLFAHSIFHQSLWNSVKIILASILLQIPLALGLALLIYRKTPTNTLFRLVFLAPYILAEIASGLIWSFIFDGDYGVSAQIASALSMPSFYILADKQFAFLAIITVIVWKYFGFHMMIFVAALQSVPEELLEAASLDCRKSWQIVAFVKLPLISHAIKLSVFFSIIGSLQVFDIIIPLTNGGPSNSTHSIVSYLYTFGLTRLNVGYGSAVGVALFLFCVFTALTYKRLVIREGKST